MALLREREPERGMDPVKAFLHDETKPSEGVVDVSGNIVPINEQRIVYGPPSPVILTNPDGSERIATIPEQTGEGIMHFLRPETRVRRVTAPPAIQIRRKLALVVSRL